MVAAIRQIVTVSAAGTLEIKSPELSPGARAEVIVLLEAAPANIKRSELLATLDALQKSLSLTTSAAAEWNAQSRQSRSCFGRGE